ncbi:hypothetical protein OG599_35105 (plasmid) [Streptomyces sp. NBC_01335]|nr:hypothetical protein OG599_35105 [Streptomyces sp. NBC_01335]
MTTTEKLSPGDVAYRRWILHTEQCATCRAGRACATTVQLGRAWRAAR